MFGSSTTIRGENNQDPAASRGGGSHIVLDASVVEIISDEMGALMESLWPELIAKLPPRPAA